MMSQDDLLLLIFKSSFAALVFLEGVIFGILPLVTRKLRSDIQELILSHSNAFAGGLFLAAGLVSLLGESMDLIEHSLNGIMTNYKLVAPFCAASGFLATFFFEKAIIFRLKKRQQTHEGHHNTEQKPLLEDGSIKGHQHVHDVVPSDISGILLLLVLSVHSVIGGIAVGMTEEREDVLVPGIAILSHKWIEGFALGASILRMGTKWRRHILMLFFYSMSEPLGVLLGWVINILVHSELILDVFQGIVGAIASGTFVYVAIIDILTEEFAHHKEHAFLKALFCIIGFVGTSLMNLLLGAH